MDVKQYMIVDLEKKGDKQMFITERVESINKSQKGMWTVKFDGSPRIFHYNPSRLLCLANPSSVKLEEKSKKPYLCNCVFHKSKFRQVGRKGALYQQ